jgi:DNA-directed RNA polymerase specialized sigma24 family protein
MPGPKPSKIELSERERQALEKVAARHTTGQQKAQRARIILRAAEGKNHTEIAKELKVSVDMATLWRGRWLALQTVVLEDLSVEERLENLARPGHRLG